ncbi:short-chain dehydrogenase reductase 3c isoform X2 [Phoenix dactylifera]|uniref:Short-chain dehydrogenase reductase 3c isoform X2 n=1 Tax=Phoenix dactylifera TaxID=42345 RepID=A0A8B7C3M4_PHODC|nr:short-chain dehydrogenase reductase 3c isoform X2 [Phoenix dactylifera]
MLRLIARRVVTARAGGCREGRVGFSSTASWRGRLQGRIALITGGASGLGKATAHEYIKEGAAVILADIDSRLGPQAAEELGPQAQFVPCDVTIEQAVADAVDFTVTCHGRLDIMYSSAGIVGQLDKSDISQLDLDQFDRVMNVNVRGTLAGIKHAARVMGPVGSGSIICTASISGLMGGLGTHPYAISKFSVVGIVKSAASELCRRGIRLNCISPFAIPTPLVVHQFSEIYKGLERERIIEIIDSLGVLKGAKCEEIDVAKAAVYLASDDAKYVTGHNLVVDGGFTTFKHLNLPMPAEVV